MGDANDKPCIVSQELINLQCLQCGAVSSGTFVAIAECPCCGALDYHVYRAYIPLDEAIRHRRSHVPDNKDVIKNIIELVQRKTR